MKKLFVFFGLVIALAAMGYAQSAASTEVEGISDCAGQMCGTFTPDCNPDVRPCYCFQIAEGGNYCADDFFCAGRTPCNTSDQCADNEVCIVQTCCGGGLCLPVQDCVGMTMGVGDGPSATGK